MASSNLNKLRNEIIAIEKRSDRYVSREKYYTLEIVFPEESYNERKVRDLGKNFVLDSDNQPLFTFVSYNKIYIFFSCLDKGSHYLDGSHQKICSKYGSEITKKVNLSEEEYISCKLIELETQNQVYIYLVWKNTETHFECISNLLENSVEDVYKNTLKESTELMKNKGIIWEDVPKFKKFGTIFRLKEKNGKLFISSFSKLLDTRKKNKHMTYLFS